MSEAGQEAFLDAERAVIGSILIDGRCFPDVAARLGEGDFALAIHREIFREAARLDAAGKPVDPVPMAEALRGQTDGQQLKSYMAQLIERTPTAANVLEYAGIVTQHARRRTLQQAWQQALAEGADEETVRTRVAAAEHSADERSAAELLSPVEQMEAFYRHREFIDSGGMPHVRTGLRKLDQMLSGGMVKKGLYFLAARPGMGKTALALAIADYVARTVGRVDFFSMEMSADQLTARRIAAQAGVNSRLVLGERLTEKEYERVSEAAVVLSQRPLYITDGQSQTVDHVSAIARSSRDCKLVVIDHFRLFQIQNRQKVDAEYAQVAHALKRLAQSLDAPVLCLTQLNRANEQRADKRPMLSDLRESGAAEEDADGVLLLYRDDYYGKTGRERKPPEPVMVDVHLAKNRHGSTGHVDLCFWPETNVFRERYVK